MLAKRQIMDKSLSCYNYHLGKSPSFGELFKFKATHWPYKALNVSKINIVMRVPKKHDYTLVNKRLNKYPYSTVLQPH